jgi:proline iminopeptidase
MSADQLQQEHAPAPEPRTPPPRTTAGLPVRLAAAAAVAAAAALLAAWWTPRGPVSTTEALVSMAAALVTGALVGWLLANRWALLLAPAVFMAVFELARLGVDGPSVDGVRLGSVYGVITLVAGRGVHGLLVLLPMVLGARVGVEVAARRGRGGAPLLRRPGRVLVVLSTVLLGALAVLVVWPASTAPVTDADGRPVEGSIAELTTVTIDGREQALMIRGTDAEAPVLLHLAGGPGGTDIGAMRLDPTLEEDFVVVTWDQPGTGKSYAAIDPVDELTPGTCRPGHPRGDRLPAGTLRRGQGGADRAVVGDPAGRAGRAA